MSSVMSSANQRRSQLNAAVDTILASASSGRVTKTTESQGIDFKEEAGRRNGANIEPGETQNNTAATQLADEVACMANSPGGGALILGVEDRTGIVIGTELAVDWLRQAIYSRIDVAPDIVEKHVEGQRVLAIFVAAAPEPVEDTSGRLRWRVGDSCRPIDRSEWWQYQRSLHSYDPMAQSSNLRVDAVRQPALAYARQQDPAFAERTPEELLRSLGAIDALGKLSQAGALLFTSCGQTVIELTIFDVPAGQVRNRIVPPPEASCLEQLEIIERALDVVNRRNQVVSGLAHQAVPEIPHAAVREALLNAMIHRDWNRSEPIEVRWIELDATLIVRSPGGFPAAITAANVLSNRAARYPALADLYRAIRLVDKQGVGVDRMYQSMIALGHRPPVIDEVAGPFVETTLVGGQPVLPVLELMNQIVPLARQSDYRITIVLYLLFQRPFITVEVLAAGLQSGREAALAALEAAKQTTVGDQPLVMEHGPVWILGTGARAILQNTPQSIAAPAAYLSTDPDEMEKTARLWFAEVGDLATSDLMALTGVSRGTAKNRLDEMVARCDITAIGAGRSTRYRQSN